jgi:hypothetical protein
MSDPRDFETGTPIDASNPPDLANPQAGGAGRDVAPELAKGVELAAKALSGATWFYWIAGLSLINSVVILSGSDWSFIIGLGITQVIDVIALSSGELDMAGKLVAFLLDVVVAGIFLGFGMLARKGHVWAFMLGMLLYSADGLIFLAVGDWLSLGFHGFALYCIGSGMAAQLELRKTGQVVGLPAPA